MYKLKKIKILTIINNLYKTIKDITHKIFFNSMEDNHTSLTNNTINDITQSQNLLKPSDNIKIRQNLTRETIKQDINKWLFKQYPSHFLSIQFPMNYRSDNYYTALDLLRKLMSRFEYHLLQSRYWNKKHIPFTVIAEKGYSTNWHFHILIDLKQYDWKHINEVIEKTTYDLKMSNEIIHIRDFTKIGESYSTKEIYINNQKVQTDRIIPSNVLFNIPVKNKTPSIAP